MALKFECTALVGVNKVGQLEQDADGYYHVTFGALELPNSIGIPYSYDLNKHVFEPNSIFMRKVMSGKLFSEVEHPEPPIKDPRHPDFEDQWVERSRQIDLRNSCGHIRSVECTPGTDPATGRPIWIIHGWIRPEGVQGNVLKSLLDNKHANVCFSLRSVIDTVYHKGVKVRVFEELITFDLVSEGGLTIATKYNSVGFEHFVTPSNKTVEIPVTMDSLVRLREIELSKQRMGLEHSVSSIDHLIKAASRSNGVIKSNALLRWGA
ncbi:MAG: S80 family phage morphogenetic serine protease [Clostridium sp.]|uniref:S80 family phage morphogenetic serine protease n=1 Tax=Clostridium sp. TaxID=1506 RepID=UPI003EE46449